MTPSDWIAGISLVVAFAALIYTIISNTKKYELTYQYYQDVVTWHSDVVKVITQQKATNVENEKKTYLAELSALIETGRFYFSNIDLQVVLVLINRWHIEVIEMLFWISLYMNINCLIVKIAKGMWSMQKVCNACLPHMCSSILIPRNSKRKSNIILAFK